MCMTKHELEILFKAHYCQMLRLAVSIVHDEDDAKDAVSNVFAHLLDDKHSTLTSDNAAHYLLVSVRHQCYNLLRQRSVRERFAQQMSLAPEPMSDPVEDLLELERLWLYVDSELPPLTRQVFALRYRDEQTYQEISDKLGLSKVTVYQHLSRALKKINDYFKNQ